MTASSPMDILNFSFRQAKDHMRKVSFKSSYGMFYGRKPDLTDMSDVDILKNKTFSELE